LRLGEDENLDRGSTRSSGTAENAVA